MITKLAFVVLLNLFFIFAVSAQTYSADMITAHNNVRANGPFGPNPAPNPPLIPLTWNTAVAATAASWAAGCQFAHNPNRGFVGENIYASTNSPTPANIVSLWASEAQFYNLSSNTCAVGQICGHYTQLVWNATTSVGCATQFCTTNSPFGGGNWYIAVCDYSPPGNFVGQRPYTVTSGGTPGTLQFSSSTYSVNEFGGGVTISVTRTGGSTGAVSVQYATSNGTATGGQDYAAAAGALSWADGDASTKSFNVPITDDNIFEGNETVNLSLSNAGGGATLGSPSGAVLTIIDNDPAPTVSIANTSSGAEPSTANVFTVTLSAQPASQVTVQYAAANGTATAGSDYTSVGGTITFPANTTTLSQQIIVPTLDDALFEGTENFTVGLSLPSGATIGGVNPATGTIADNETQPKFSINSVSKNEGNSGLTSFTFNITLSGPTAQFASVNYSTSDGTAAAPGDYTAIAPTQVIFNPGDPLTKSVTVLVNGDTIVEQNETFFINLTGAVNAGILTAQGTGTIVNDDAGRRVAFDYDGDGKTDVSVFRPSNNTWYLNRSQAGFAAVQFGAAGDIITPVDFTGDGKTDIAVFRPSNGTWYVLRSEDSTFYSAGFGQIGDIPAPADYDGDGKADMAVYRPSVGTWYLQRSTAGFVATQFGVAEDRPATGDFDGDGKADISVYRPSTGTWYRLNSFNGTFTGIQFGTAGDKIVPADYTGDGKTDIAVWRPSNGTWYVQRSEDLSFYGAGFGLPTDLPAPGDFDGDGKADLAVYRPSTGDWFTMQSTSGFSSVHFGIAEDRPTPSAFVY